MSCAAKRQCTGKRPSPLGTRRPQAPAINMTRGNTIRHKQAVPRSLIPRAPDEHRLPEIPDPLGFSGSYAGVSNGALIVAGGANFPGRMPWEGGEKIWHDELFVLDAPSGDWKTGFRLPRALAYGTALTVPAGVLCIGGSDHKQA